MKIRQQYAPEFKKETIQLPQTSGRSAALLERELGIGDGNLWCWKERAAEDREDAFPGHGCLTSEQDEIRRLMAQSPHDGKQPQFSHPDTGSPKKDPARVS